MKRIIVISIINLFILNSYSQEFKDSVYIHLTNFLLMKGELQVEDIKGNKLKDLVVVKNEFDKDSQDYGIYIFYGAVHNEVSVSVFIMKHDQIEIFDLSEVNVFYSRLSILFEEFPDVFDKTTILKYLNKVSEMFDTYSDDDLENL